MKDRWGRVIDYLRVSVTDRCNLRCVYCMPQDGIQPADPSEILTYEEIAFVVQVARELGVTHVRITGGEPLVREGIPRLVRMIKQAGIEDIALTTNGTLLQRFATQLRASGLNRVNISLDSLQPETYRRMTRNGDIEEVLSGIRAAVSAGLDPVKINAVMVAGMNFDDIVPLAELTLSLPVHVRFIELMPIGPIDVSTTITADDIMRKLGEIGEIAPSEPPPGAGPARTFRFSRAKGTVGIIAPMSQPFCADCNRIRLTPDGKLRPCLAHDVEIDVKSILRDEPVQVARDRLKEAFMQAVSMKPSAHNLGYNPVHARRMCQIGG